MLHIFLFSFNSIIASIFWLSIESIQIKASSLPLHVDSLESADDNEFKEKLVFNTHKHLNGLNLIAIVFVLILITFARRFISFGWKRVLRTIYKKNNNTELIARISADDLRVDLGLIHIYPNYNDENRQMYKLRYIGECRVCCGCRKCRVCH